MKTSLTKRGLPPRSRIELEELGLRLRRLRKSRGYSRDRLAELSYIGRNTLARMEAGDPGVAIGAWVQVLHVLGNDRTLALLLEVPREDGIESHARRKGLPDINVLAESL